MKTTWFIRHGVAGLGVLLLGLAFGYRGFGTDRSPVAASESKAYIAKPADPSFTSGRSQPGLSASEEAEAWESLKDRNLPRRERIDIQIGLLREWAQRDLASALHAVFAETDLQDLLAAFDEAILAKPMEAWDLAKSKAFGWESARLRGHFLKLLGERDPSRLFGLFDQMSGGERLDAAEAAMIFSLDQLPATNLLENLHGQDFFKQILALESRPDGSDLLRMAGTRMAGGRTAEDLALLLEGTQSEAERKLFLAAYSARLFDDQEFDDGAKLERFPAEVRAELAALALRKGYADSHLLLDFAEVAVEVGDLDSLKAASGAHAFMSFSQSLQDSGKWADWALALPEDPRTIDTFGQVMIGAAYCDLEGTRPKIEALPPGKRRDLGYAALVYAVRAEEEGEEGEFESKIPALLEQISDPVLRAEVDKHYR